MTEKHRVLIFPAGSEIGLEIFHALKYSHHVDAFGASGKSDHASFLYDADRYVEDHDLYVERPDFVDRLNRHLDNWRIEFIFPTHDTIANVLAASQVQLHARVLTSCAETNRIARSKSATYDTFRCFDFCPVVYSPSYGDLPYPVFLKPDEGQGGKGTAIASDRRDLEFHLSKAPDLLVTEYLPGEELSVDCFTDRGGNLLFAGPRTRERVQMGISFRSTALALTDEVRHIAERINSTVALDGAWFFQVKQDAGGRYKLIEFAPRQSSTMGLYRHAGVNFALLSLFNGLGLPIAILRNDYAVQLDRCLHNRFKADLRYTRVYIDLDETLIAGRQVHDRVMAFVYQCRNRGIAVVLLTKHRHDLKATLHDSGIAESLFERIVHIAEDANKWDFIDPEGAIFVDNHWHDRREVAARLRIPVFDVDAVECLLR